MQLFPDILLNKVWHVTSIDHLKNIYKEGSLYANPSSDLLLQKKWGNVAARSGKTYVQSLDGISVFDLINFNYLDYLRKIDPPRNAVKNIVNSRLVQGSCVWIEIDIEDINFINRDTLYHKWLEDIKSELNLQFLPGLEATIIGDVSFHKIKNIYLYVEISDSYKKLDINDLLEF